MSSKALCENCGAELDPPRKSLNPGVASRHADQCSSCGFRSAKHSSARLSSRRVIATAPSLRMSSANAWKRVTPMSKRISALDMAALDKMGTPRRPDALGAPPDVPSQLAAFQAIVIKDAEKHVMTCNSLELLRLAGSRCKEAHTRLFRRALLPSNLPDLEDTVNHLHTLYVNMQADSLWKETSQRPKKLRELLRQAITSELLAPTPSIAPEDIDDCVDKLADKMQTLYLEDKLKDLFLHLLITVSAFCLFAKLHYVCSLRFGRIPDFLSPADLKYVFSLLALPLYEVEETDIERFAAKKDGYIPYRLMFRTLMHTLHSLEDKSSIEYVREVFTILDSAGDGVLCLEDIYTGLADMGIPKSREECQTLIERFDTDMNGELGIEEFTALMRTKVLTDVETIGIEEF